MHAQAVVEETQARLTGAVSAAARNMRTHSATEANFGKKVLKRLVGLYIHVLEKFIAAWYICGPWH